jgi:NDP-sugar pyrophosphorylase family protein
MLPVHGKPLLQHTVEWLRDHGVRQIAVNLHHHPETVVEHFGDGARFGVELEYSHETTLLGTAGAAKRLQSFLDETFVVVYGDVFTNVDLARLKLAHAQHRAAGSHHREYAAARLTMLLYTVPNPEECGLVEVDSRGRIVRFVEKPPRDLIFTDQAFSGVMLCEPGVLEYAPPDAPFDFGHDLLPKLMGLGAPLHAQSLSQGEFVIDIGTLGGYLRALATCTRPVGMTAFRQPQPPVQALS